MRFIRPIGLALVATAVHAEPPVGVQETETCPIEGKVAVLEASRKGYVFSAMAAAGTDATCKFEKSGEILVVSAPSGKDGSCAFELFVPPVARRPLVVIRVALKAASDSSITYLQRGPNPDNGIAVSLSTGKGTTAQYRVAHVELPSVADKCEPVSKIGAQL
jgi:hypothetical protein